MASLLLSLYGIIYHHNCPHPHHTRGGEGGLITVSRLYLSLEYARTRLRKIDTFFAGLKLAPRSQADIGRSFYLLRERGGSNYDCVFLPGGGAVSTTIKYKLSVAWINIYLLLVEHHSCCPHCFPLGRGPPLGYRAEIRTRACRTASRRATI
jgi:hypothetical protein